jgi:hypothetical protein
MTTALKVSFAGEIRRFSSETLTCAALRQAISERFDGVRSDDHLALQYIDDDGDCISIGDDSDLLEALRVAAGLLRIEVVTCTDSSIQALRGENVAVQLHPCLICGRKFTEKALERHSKICAKTVSKKRKTFDSTATRVKGTDAEYFVKAKENESAEEKGVSAECAARKADAHSWLVAQAIKGDKDLRSLPPVPPLTPDASSVSCPHCDRSFSGPVAERHIPRCKSIKSKPKMLKRGTGRWMGAKEPKGKDPGTLLPPKSLSPGLSGHAWQGGFARSKASTPLVLCPRCNRSFSAKAFERHGEICASTTTKREVFDSAEQRAKDTDAAWFMKDEKNGKREKQARRRSNWKAQSVVLREAMKASKAAKKVEGVKNVEGVKTVEGATKRVDRVNATLSASSAMHALTPQALIIKQQADIIAQQQQHIIQQQEHISELHQMLVQAPKCSDQKLRRNGKYMATPSSPSWKLKSNQLREAMRNGREVRAHGLAHKKAPPRK